MAETRLEVWQDKRDEWRWSLWARPAAPGRPDVTTLETKVAVSPASYPTATDASNAFSTLVDALRFDNPTRSTTPRSSS